MGITNAEVKKIVRAIQALGVRGAPFQFQALREKLGIEASETVRSAYTHNLLKEFLKQGVLEIVPGGRQRNRYYRIKSEWKLDAVAQRSSPFFYDVEGKGRPASKADERKKAKTSAALVENVD